MTELQVVLFTWLAWLQEETLPHLGLQDGLDLAPLLPAPLHNTSHPTITPYTLIDDDDAESSIAADVTTEAVPGEVSPVSLAQVDVETKTVEKVPVAEARGRDGEVGGVVLCWDPGAGGGLLELPGGVVAGLDRGALQSRVQLRPGDRVLVTLEGSVTPPRPRSVAPARPRVLAATLLGPGGRLSATVKKWNEKTGRGFLRQQGGLEWSVQARDCLQPAIPGFQRFKPGDMVTFQQAEQQRGKTPKAQAVTLAGEEEEEERFNFNKEETNRVAGPAPEITTSVVQDTSSEVETCGESMQSTEQHEVQVRGVGERPGEERPAEEEGGLCKEGRRLVRLLQEFSERKDEEQFRLESHTCGVCLTDRVGSQCVRFTGCGHAYCRDCVAGYLTVRIREGAVAGLACPTPDCTSQILPHVISDLVPAALYQRYEQLLLETQLQTMVDVVLCPRTACQCPTVIERDTSLGQCPACSLAFCIYCNQTYHGVSPCKFRSAEQRAILDQYRAAEGGERQLLERRYGKRQLETMANTLASEDYVTAHAQHCPHCRAPIEKNDGCNKITCWRCETNFCWLCGTKLPKVNPYSHFNARGGKCYGALFEGVDPLQVLHRCNELNCN